MSLKPYAFRRLDFEEWLKELDDVYTIPDPNESLIEIYEMDTIKDAIHIRAEKWDSPEWQSDLEKIMNPIDILKVPRNILNPNYSEIFDLLKKLRNIPSNPETEDEAQKLMKEKEIAFNKLANWIAKYISLAGVKLPDDMLFNLEPLPDIRFLKFLLRKTEPKINVLMIRLLLSYIFKKYTTVGPIKQEKVI